MKLKEIMDNKNHTEFFEDEKDLLWKLRTEVRDRYHENLSKLLLITKWNRREDVVQVLMEILHIFLTIMYLVYHMFSCKGLVLINHCQTGLSNQ